MKEKLFSIAWVVIGVLACLSIALVNFFLFKPWFYGRSPLNLGSIEVSYVSMARFIIDYYPHLSFAPYWYFGFPFHLFYTPILPVLEVVLYKLGQVPLWQAYRIASGLGLVLAPVSLFLFVWYLTKKIIPGIFAGIFYTFVPTIFDFVLSSHEVADDTITKEMLDPRRIVMLARWGEGPHILSLVFIPLAGLFFLSALKRGKMVKMVFAAVFIGLVALTNAVGLYGLALLLAAIIFGRLVWAKKKGWKVVGRSFLALALAYGLVAFWYNLSFMSTFFGEGGGVLKNYLNLFPWGWLLFGACLTGLYFAIQRFIKNQGLIISLLWFLSSFAVVYVYYISAPPEFSNQRVELAPQALRLMAEVDLALAALAGAVLGWFLAFFSKRGFILRLAGNLIGVALVLVVGVYGLAYLPYGAKAVSGTLDLHITGEAQIADWLRGKVDPKLGERVFLGGNYAFYLNWFSGTWQLRGGLYQAKTHYWSEHIYYQICNGKSREIALNWLKIANVKYIVVNTPASQELYKDYKVPEKFSGLTVEYNHNGDVVYKVPLKSTLPVKIVDLQVMNSLAVPAKADDAGPIAGYVAWLDRSKPAAFESINNDSYKIKAQVGPGEGILVQMTADLGFSARTLQGGAVKIIKDPLGFMVLSPGEGEWEINLTHGKTWKIWLGYVITLGTIAFLLGYLINGVLKKTPKEMSNS